MLTGRCSAPTKWHAATPSPGRAASAGRSVRQRSKAYGQRGWNGQPGGMARGLGSSPRTAAVGGAVGRVEDRGGGQQRLRVGVGGEAKSVSVSAELDHAAEIHHRDPVRDVPHQPQVVGDEQDGQAEPRLQLEQQVDDLGLDRDVEGGDQLVGDQALGLDRERAGDADALALAARELVRVAERGVGRQADEVEQLARCGPGSRPAAARRWTRSASASMPPTVWRGLSEP